MNQFLWENFFRKKNKSNIEFLKTQPLFESLSVKELKLVERLVHHRTYFSGEEILKPGSSMGLYMIVKGKVNIFYDSPNEEKSSILSRLSEGDFFGELSLVREKGYHKTTAKAMEPAELLGFFRPELLSLIEKSPKIGSKILMKLAEILGLRLKKAGEQLGAVPVK